MDPYAAILMALANRGPLNKSEIQEQAKVARQTVYDWLGKLERSGSARVQRTEKSRTGIPTKYYELTDSGMYRVAIGREISKVNPELASRVRHQLGTKFGKFEGIVRSNREEEVEHLTGLIKELILSRKARPGYYLKIDFHANESGDVTYSFKTGTSTTP
jgi:predicted ArsR family transcriptional regulator